MKKISHTTKIIDVNICDSDQIMNVILYFIILDICRFNNRVDIVKQKLNIIYLNNIDQELMLNDNKNISLEIYVCISLKKLFHRFN